MAGPLPRKQLYRHLMKNMYETGFFDDWRQTQEVCREANKGVPSRWTPIYPSNVHRYARELPMQERFRWDNSVNSMVREWKKT